MTGSDRESKIRHLQEPRRLHQLRHPRAGKTRRARTAPTACGEPRGPASGGHLRHSSRHICSRASHPAPLARAGRGSRHEEGQQAQPVDHLSPGGSRQISPALVVSLIALLIALGGTSYAALSIPRNSVGSAQVINGSLQSVDLSKQAAAALKGKAGSQGIPGTTGQAGAIGPGRPVQRARACGLARPAGAAGSRARRARRERKARRARRSPPASRPLAGRDAQLVGRSLQRRLLRLRPPARAGVRRQPHLGRQRGRQLADGAERERRLLGADALRRPLGCNSPTASTSRSRSRSTAATSGSPTSTATR